MLCWVRKNYFIDVSSTFFVVFFFVMNLFLSVEIKVFVLYRFAVMLLQKTGLAILILDHNPVLSDMWWFSF